MIKMKIKNFASTERGEESPLNLTLHLNPFGSTQS